MATNLHKVIANFRYHIEAIVPSETGLSNDTWTHVDTMEIDPGMRTRLYRVSWDASDTDIGITNVTDRIAPHDFTVECYYPVGESGYSWTDAHALALQDRHDLAKKLRNPNNKNTPSNAGLIKRFRESDELDRESIPNVWTLRQRWRCHVLEAE